jgi:hypothetical protein
MAIGYIGPRRIPMKEIAMALPIKDGVNHIVISKLLVVRGTGSVHIGRIVLEPKTYPIARNA